MKHTCYNMCIINKDLRIFPYTRIERNINYDKLFALLKAKGWNTAKIRKESLIGQGTLTALSDLVNYQEHLQLLRQQIE